MSFHRTSNAIIKRVRAPKFGFGVKLKLLCIRDKRAIKLRVISVPLHAHTLALQTDKLALRLMACR
jgi:hypothetical protein